MFIVFWGPFAAAYRLRWWTLGALLPSMLVMGLGLGLDKTPGQPSPAAYLAAAIASASLLLTFGIWAWWALWWDLESVFRMAPWKTQQINSKDGKGVLCPFTVGDDVADWARVQRVVHNEPDIAKARQLTDEATEFRSNYIWIAITDCCKACETWKKCFNLVPRHALSLSFVGWFGAFVVWGFSDALTGTGSTTGQIVSQTFGTFYALCGLLMMLWGVGWSIAFIEVHRKQIRYGSLCKPITNPLLRGLACQAGPWAKHMTWKADA